MDLSNVGKVVLVGGAGFLGHHLALALKSKGVDVSIIDAFTVNNVARMVTDTGPYRDRSLKMLEQRIDLLRVAEVPLHCIDATDYHALSRTLEKIQPDRICHLAAVAHAGRSNKDKHDAFLHTVVTLKNCIDYSVGAGVKQLTFNSSSLRYGHFQDPAYEDRTLAPIGHYGNLKVIGERLLISAHQVEGLPYTIVVPSALIGPRCISRRVVQVFIENCLDGQPLQVAGNGEERIDFTSVYDYVQGMLLILSQPEALNETFNITYGQGRSLNEVVGILRKYFPTLTVEYSPWDSAYPSRNSLNIEKAQVLLGYQPEYPLERTIKAYLDWYAEFPI